MTGHDGLEKRLPGYLNRRAPTPPAGLLDDVLRQAAALPQRGSGLAFTGFAWWGVGAAAAAVLLVTALALRSALPGPSVPGGQASPSSTAGQSMTTITVPSPDHDKAMMEQAATIMGERLRALGIGNFSAAAGDDLTFSFVLPPSVDPVDVSAVLSTPGVVEWLAWSEAPWPVEGGPVREGVLPLFDASDQILSASVQPAGAAGPDSVLVTVGTLAADAIGTYTSEHVGEPAMPLAMDGVILLAPTIQVPIMGGEVVITFPSALQDAPISPRAFAAILASGPLPAGWTTSAVPSRAIDCGTPTGPGAPDVIRVDDLGDLPRVGMVVEEGVVVALFAAEDDGGHAYALCTWFTDQTPPVATGSSGVNADATAGRPLRLIGANRAGAAGDLVWTAYAGTADAGVSQVRVALSDGSTRLTPVNGGYFVVAWPHEAYATSFTALGPSGEALETIGNAGLDFSDWRSP
jgi:hypothetical protein